MALLWSFHAGNSVYRVTAAGSSRRLYTDGILHSQYNPHRIATGSIWDLLWLPIFFSATPRVERVLLLGAGAGAVIRQLDLLFQPREIIAVENDPIHLTVARNYFGVTPKMAKIHLGDAEEFVNDYDGPKFDLVIDDLFFANAGVPQRAVDCNCHWIGRLTRHLALNGVLSINFSDKRELDRSLRSAFGGAEKRFRSGFELSAPSIENVVVAMLPWCTESNVLRTQLKANPMLAGALRLKQLRYRVRKINFSQ